MQEPVTDQQRATKSDGHFNIDFVQQVVTYLSMLVVMGIDKCTPRCLIICSNLFERYFDETYPYYLSLQCCGEEDVKRVQG